MNTYIKDRVEEEELESWLCSYHGGIMAGNDELAKKMFLATINNRLTQAYQQGEKKGAERLHSELYQRYERLPNLTSAEIQIEQIRAETRSERLKTLLLTLPAKFWEDQDHAVGGFISKKALHDILSNKDL